MDIAIKWDCVGCKGERIRYLSDPNWGSWGMTYQSYPAQNARDNNTK